MRDPARVNGRAITRLRLQRRAADPVELERMRAAGREVQRRRAGNPLTRAHDRLKRRERTQLRVHGRDRTRD